MNTSKTVNKTVLILALILAVTLQASAQEMSESKLEKEDIDLEPQDDGIRVNSTYFDEELSWEEALLPDSYQSDLNNFVQPTDISADSSGNAPFVLNYGFKNFKGNKEPEAIPESLSNYRHQESTHVNITGDGGRNLTAFEEDDLFSMNSGRIRVNMTSHYNVLIANYTILDEDEEDVIATEQDRYISDDPGLIPFETEADTNNEEGTATQKITKDHLYQKEDTARLAIMNNADSEVEDVDFDGLEHEECEDNSYVEDDRPELQDAGVDSELIIDGTFGYEYSCYNLTLPEDSKPELEINYSYDDFTEENEDEDELTITETPNFYAYIIGSGGATRIESSSQICGEEDNKLDGYDNIIIEGTVSINCDAEIEADNLIEIEEGGEINGYGEDGADSNGGSAEQGEEGYNLELDSENVRVNGDVDLYGGDGGDGDSCDELDGAKGGQGGELTINSFKSSIDGEINLKGGDGGSGYRCYEDGNTYSGDGKDAADAGKLNVDTDYLNTEGATILHNGGQGGRGANGDWDPETETPEENGGDGGEGGDASDLDISAIELILDDTNINGQGGLAGDAGWPDSFSDQQGGLGATTDLEASTLNLTDSEIDVSSGDSGYVAAEFNGVDGPDGGTINLNGQNREVINSDFIAQGGDGGPNEAECGDYDEYEGGEGGDGGEINHNLYEKTIEDTEYNVRGGDGGDGEGCTDNDAEGGDGGDGGIIEILWRDDLSEAFNDFIDDGGDGEGGSGENGVDGDSGNTTIEQDEDLSIDSSEGEGDVEIEEINISSEDGEQQDQIDQRNNVTKDVKFTSDEELDETPTTSWFNEEDETIVNRSNMELVSEENESGEYEYHYNYTHNITQSAESGGEWLTDVQIEDNYGNTYTDTKEFVYQNTETDRGNPIQRQATFGQTIPYDQRVTYENPSETGYSDVEVRFHLFEGVTGDFFEVTRESDDSEVDYEYNEEENYLYWNASIGGRSSNDYNIQYDLEEIDVDEEVEIQEEDGRRTAYQVLTVESPSPNITIQDIDAEWDFEEPERVVDWDLFFGEEEVTFDENFNPTTSDSDNTGYQNQLNWNIDSLNPDEEAQEYTIESDLGEPIIKHRDDVIRNRPVEEGKPIQWRVGFAFENNNDFLVPYSDRLRVPLDASNIRLDGQLQDSNFDGDGTYAVFEEDLEPNSNQTAFLKYETRSISTTESTDRPENHTVDEPSTVRHKLSVENLADQELNNVTDTISVDYAEDLKLLDEEDEEVLDEEDRVQDEYEVRLDSLEDEETRDLQISYEIPTASSEHVRNGKTDDGENMAVWEIKNDNNQLLENVQFVNDEIDCVDVEEVRVLESTNSSGTETIDNYECGSTIVPIGELESDETMRIGISYKGEEKEFSDGSNGTMNVLFGIGKWIVVTIVILGLAELVRRWLE